VREVLVAELASNGQQINIPSFATRKLRPKSQY